MSLLGRRAMYYRPLYSLFAFLHLGVVIAVQFSIKSFYLASFPLLKYLVGLFAGLPGVILMIVCIRKYFFNLSGVKAFLVDVRKMDKLENKIHFPEISDDRPSADEPAVRKDEDARLESEGVHAYVRHPLYLGTLATLWSVFLFFPLLSNLLACLSITVYTLIGIRLEEQKLLEIYGEAYAAYRRRTPMLIPSFPLR
jgi:protein-S-isoprenylcysteine O-methyltransferase Ste14